MVTGHNDEEAIFPAHMIIMIILFCFEGSRQMTEASRRRQELATGIGHGHVQPAQNTDKSPQKKCNMIKFNIIVIIFCLLYRQLFKVFAPNIKPQSLTRALSLDRAVARYSTNFQSSLHHLIYESSMGFHE